MHVIVISLPNLFYLFSGYAISCRAPKGGAKFWHFYFYMSYIFVTLRQKKGLKFSFSNLSPSFIDLGARRCSNQNFGKKAMDGNGG